MKTVFPTPRRRTLFARSIRLTTGLTLSALGFVLHTEARAEVAAVASRAFNGYKRTRLPDKSFQPETYAFAPGGLWDAAIADDSLDDVNFMTIARTLKGPLATRGYVMDASKDPEKTDLLIFVFWGTTQGSDRVDVSEATYNLQRSLNARGPAPRITERGGELSPSGIDGSLTAEEGVAKANMDILESDMISLTAENRYREKLNERNAGILGFQDNLQRAYLTNFTTAATDVVDELEVSRYFVVLKAYDFRLAWKEKRRKVLWETRFSIAKHRNDFSEQLAGMVQQASKYFGVHTHGLVRESLPDVQVTYGEATTIKD